MPSSTRTPTVSSGPAGRATSPGSAWIVNRTGERVLLAHHRKLGLWLQPGGHCDGDPDTLAVALREAREESGLAVRALETSIFDLDVHPIPAHGREPAHHHHDVRFLVRAGEDRFRVSEESRALAWVPAGEVSTLTDRESVLRMARKWLSRQATAMRNPDSARGNLPRNPRWLSQDAAGALPVRDRWD